MNSNPLDYLLALVRMAGTITVGRSGEIRFYWDILPGCGCSYLGPDGDPIDIHFA